MKRDRIPNNTVHGARLLNPLGAERWRQKRTALGAVLNKNPDVVSVWAGEGTRRRQEDVDYAAKLDQLDRQLSASLTRKG